MAPTIERISSGILFLVRRDPPPLDPDSDANCSSADHRVVVKERRNKQGQVVCVTNFNQRNNDRDEPKPGYTGAYYDKDEKSKSSSR